MVPRFAEVDPSTCRYKFFISFEPENVFYFVALYAELSFIKYTPNTCFSLGMYLCAKYLLAWWGEMKIVTYARCLYRRHRRSPRRSTLSRMVLLIFLGKSNHFSSAAGGPSCTYSHGERNICAHTEQWEFSADLHSPLNQKMGLVHKDEKFGVLC